MSVALFVVFGLLLLIVVSGLYVFVVACVRRKELPWLVEQEIRKTSYAKYASSIVAADQWLKDHKANDIYITSDDGLKLHGLWVQAKNAKGTVLLAHGYRSTFLLDFSHAFAFYHDYGMNLLIPEQRSHGQSEGRYITFGVKESQDMIRWIEFHNRTFGPCSLILSGLSMGASTVLYLADKKLPENVKGIIADCGFSSPKAILSSVFTRVTHLPAAISMWVTDLATRMIAGFRLSQEDTCKSLSKSKVPVILIHGLDDDFVPCDMTKDGYRVCASAKQLLLVEGAGHGTSFLCAKEKYIALIETFLQTYL